MSMKKKVARATGEKLKDVRKRYHKHEKEAKAKDRKYQSDVAKKGIGYVKTRKKRKRA